MGLPDGECRLTLRCRVLPRLPLLCPGSAPHFELSPLPLHSPTANICLLLYHIHWSLFILLFLCFAFLQFAFGLVLHLFLPLAVGIHFLDHTSPTPTFPHMAAIPPPSALAFRHHGPPLGSSRHPGTPPPSPCLPCPMPRLLMRDRDTLSRVGHYGARVPVNCRSISSFLPRKTS